MDIIKVQGLTKKFGDFTAVDGITFSVKKGEIFGFLGPNGAGKSTTIKMLSTLLPPSEGEAFINDASTTTERDDVRRSIGLVFQDPSLDDQLTASENLKFHARLYGVPNEEYEKRMEEVLRLVDLWDRKDDIAKTFSGGMKRRLEIARGLIHYPSVLFLDEPTIGLDPQTRAHLWDYILKLKHEKQMTIFMTTHYMNEAEYCDRIAVIDHGKIVALDTPEQLKKKVGGDVITIKSKQIAAIKKEMQVPASAKIREEENTISIEIENGGAFLPQLLKTISANIDTVELRKPTLDDVFLDITGRTMREEEASSKDTMRQFMRMRRR
jgi:ABC-2 type transport system ATP-binding protein